MSRLTNALIATTLLASGCATPVQDLALYLPPIQREEHHLTVKQVKEHYFTTKAQRRLDQVPFYDGPALGGYAAVNTWGKIASALSGHGLEDNVVIPPGQLRAEGISILLHEYIHVLDYYDREGEDEYIDHAKFRNAYHRFLKDPSFKTAAEKIKKRSGNASWFTSIVGIGELSEELAWTSCYAAVNPQAYPTYLKETLTLILKKNILFPQKTRKQ